MQKISLYFVFEEELSYFEAHTQSLLVRTTVCRNRSELRIERTIFGCWSPTIDWLRLISGISNTANTRFFFDYFASDRWFLVFFVSSNIEYRRYSELIFQNGLLVEPFFSCMRTGRNPQGQSPTPSLCSFFKSQNTQGPWSIATPPIPARHCVPSLMRNHGNERSTCRTC